MAQQLELILGAKDQTAPAFSALNKHLQDSDGKLRTLNQGWVGGAKSAAGFADNVGQVSKTLARSADAFGLPTQALRTLDDVMDVADMGLNNLTKSAAGFNAASIGVAGAGLAIGTAIGTAIRNFTGLGEWLDKVADKMTGLTAVEEEAREASRKALAVRQANIQAFLGNDQAVSALTVSKVKEKEATEALEKASKLLGVQVRDVHQAERILAEAEANSTAGRKRAAEAHEKAAEAAKKYAAELRNLTEEALGAAAKQGAGVGFVLPELKISTPEIGILGQTMVGMPELTQRSYENLRHLADEAARAGLGAEQIEKKLIAAGVPAEDAARLAGEMTANLNGAAGAAESLGAALTTSFQKLPGVIVGAIQGGGDVLKAVGAQIGGDLGMTMGKQLGPALSSHLGKTMGGLLSSALGPVIGLIGGWLGDKIGDFFGKLFGDKTIMKINDLRDAFIGAHGGWLELQHEIAKATDQDLLKQLFDAKTPEQYEAAIKAINDALATLSGKTLEPIVIPVEYQPGEISGQPEPLPAAAHGAIVLPFIPRAQHGALVRARPGGSLVRMGEGGEAELAAPVRALTREIGAAAAAAAGAGAGGVVEWHVYLDGREITAAVERRVSAGLAPKLRGA